MYINICTLTPGVVHIAPELRRATSQKGHVKDGTQNKHFLSCGMLSLYSCVLIVALLSYRFPLKKGKA